ncbi:hypothetical protein CYK37_09215 [Mesorhizobium loti]|nr:hypothetical protein [Mesorhizobium loti]PLP59492.1 hypothetical protein CYK37_09215 [Mesorhizobium loti]
MIRTFILISLVLLCACASAQSVPRAPIKAATPDVAEPLDPSIKPLSQELEEAGQKKRGPA